MVSRVISLRCPSSSSRPRPWGTANAAAAALGRPEGYPQLIRLSLHAYSKAIRRAAAGADKKPSFLYIYGLNKEAYHEPYPIALPKLGIRPCIDGRRNGVREGLEDQTMGMARAAARLIAENLRYPNGAPVEVVVSDTTIGGVAEAARCQRQFEEQGVQVTLTVSPCWCYSTEVMDFDPQTIKAVWGFNGTERPGAVFLAAVLAAHAQKGLPAHGIYGRDVQDAGDAEIPEDVRHKILLFAKAAIAVKCMRLNSYLQIGSMCMGIAGSILDQDVFYRYFGLRSESVDETEILRRIDKGIYDPQEFERALAWTREHCREGRDRTPAACSSPRREGRAVGVRGRVPHRARSHDRQPALGARLRRGEQRP